jgi:hypothetical protein
MKKSISYLLAFTSCLFANEISLSPIEPNVQTPINMKTEATTTAKQGFFYLRFVTADSDLIHANSICPGFGLGYRRLAGDGAIDLSISGNGSSHFSKSCWTFPKLSYLHYLNPNEARSYYMGGGLAWGGVHPERKTDFIGIIPSFTLGYEIAHKAPLLGFIELNVSQPAVPLEKKGRFPGPIAEISVGGGF